MPLILGFVELLGGVLLLTSGITTASFAQIVKGQARDVLDANQPQIPSSSTTPATAAQVNQATGATVPAGQQTTGAPLNTGNIKNAVGDEGTQSFPTYVGKAIAGGGFAADPGTGQTEGNLPIITADLDALGRSLGETIVGISGYRTPAHSVAVGGSAADPHTLGNAEDIGVNSNLRSSAASIPEKVLAAFGLWRPFDPTDDPNNSEVNHIELLGMS